MSDDDLDSKMPPPPSPPPLFRILKTAASPASDIGARLGCLALPGARGPPLPTPAFVAVTSRGSVPHVTPDNATRYPLFPAAYFALEDFVEKIPMQPGRTPPILSTPSSSSSSSSSTGFSPLHAFTATPPTTLSILAARRHPPAAAHLGNGLGHISIVTSTGFQKLDLDEYHQAVDFLQPDIVVPLADLTYSSGGSKDGDHSSASVPHPTAKRAVRMVERTEDWIDACYQARSAWSAGSATSATPATSPPASHGLHVFAPTLPVSYALQWQYLNTLAEFMQEDDDAEQQNDVSNGRFLAGLAVYDTDLLPDIRADYATSVARLPRMSLHPAPTPHEMLRQIALGVDILVLPSITAASEAGLAYVFSWKEAEQRDDAAGAAKRPLAIDLADPQYRTDVGPLAPGCSCPACASSSGANHHRAYLHHLLDAHEMLAWTLLQIHNHHVVAELLSDVRETLHGKESAESADSADSAESKRADASLHAFETVRLRFQAMYEPDLPPGRATRPRARGYHAPANGVSRPSADSRLNKPAWGRLGQVAQDEIFKV